MTNPGFMASQAAQQASQANWAAQQAAQQASMNAIRSAQQADQNARQLAFTAEQARLASSRARAGRPVSASGAFGRVLTFLIGLAVLAGMAIVGWLVLGGDQHALRAILAWLRRTF